MSGYKQSHQLILAVATPSSRNYVVLSAITALYAMSASAALTSLQDLDLSEKIDISTSDGYFAGIGRPDTLNGDSFFPTIQQVVSLIIADGLLVSFQLNLTDSYPPLIFRKIWRCYRIWNNSFRVLVLCLSFYLPEIGILLLLICSRLKSIVTNICSTIYPSIC